MTNISNLIYFTMKSEKPLVWIKTQIKTPPFSAVARIEAGTQLRRIQYGEYLLQPYSKPMKTIGKNCHELLIKDSENKKEWRIIYHIASSVIVILNTFEKKTKRTPQKEIELSKKRLKEFNEDIKEWWIQPPSATR